MQVKQPFFPDRVASSQIIPTKNTPNCQSVLKIVLIASVCLTFLAFIATIVSYFLNLPQPYALSSGVTIFFGVTAAFLTLYQCLQGGNNITELPVQNQDQQGKPVVKKETKEARPHDFPYTKPHRGAGERSPKVKEESSSSNPISVPSTNHSKQYGNQFLLEIKERKLLSYHPDLHRSINWEGVFFNELVIGCSKGPDWKLADHLLGRTWTKEDVAAFSVKELNQLPPEEFFAIADLINAEQAMQLFQTDKTLPTRKLALCYVNPDFARAFARYQKSLYFAEVEQSIRERANKVFQSLKTISPEGMRSFMESAAYRALDKTRTSPSYTLTTGYEGRDIKEHQIAWQKLNQEYLADGLVGPKPLTKELIVKINTALRESALKNSASEKSGFRVNYECSDPMRQRFYTPAFEVERSMEEAIAIINEGIEACDRKEENPFIVAAKAHQIFVSIHCCHDGNGRTFRFIADLILRRYGLLPASWSINDKDCMPAVLPFNDNSSTPTEAVHSLTNAVQRSYHLMEA